MPDRTMPDRAAMLIEARAAYARGENVTALLRTREGSEANSPEIIEAAYDLQAGSYVTWALADPAGQAATAAEMAGHLAPHLRAGDALLDAGTGELTTLAHLVRALPMLPAQLLAFDLSWSRLVAGRAFAAAMLPAASLAALSVFSAEIGAIPLDDAAVEVTVTNHALEPNGGTLPALLAELFRVTRRVLVLFEPCREIATPEGQARMDRLGYIRELEATARGLGGRVLSVTPMRRVANPLNPTAVFVIEPPGPARPAGRKGHTLPGTALPLVPVAGHLYSPDTGLCLPVLDGIPILRPGTGFLASGLAASLADPAGPA